MPPSPKGKPSQPRPPDRPSDRTSAVVAATLAALAILGVTTIFSEPLMALVAPPSPDHAGAAEPGHPPPLPAAADGGAAATSARTDGAANS